MPQDANGARRGPDGKFLPGHKPPKSPGRPPGPNGVKARASRIASERLEQMLGKAADAIDDALDNGDTHVATWLIDRVRPPKQTDFLKTDIVSELSTPAEIVEAARLAVVATGKGDISLSDGRAYIDLLARYGGIHGYLEVERLKAKMDELSVARPTKMRVMDQSRLPPESRLQWGNGVAANSSD